jgi:hypothetical protein
MGVIVVVVDMYEFLVDFGSVVGGVERIEATNELHEGTQPRKRNENCHTEL